MILFEKENYSSWIRDACYEKLEKEKDPKYFNNKILEHKEAIKQLEQLKKLTKKEIEDNGHKIHECIRYWHDVYKDKEFKDKSELVKIIENRVLPKVRSLGYDKSAEDLADVFLEWPEEGVD